MSKVFSNTKRDSRAEDGRRPSCSKPWKLVANSTWGTSAGAFLSQWEIDAASRDSPSTCGGSVIYTRWLTVLRAVLKLLMVKFCILYSLYLFENWLWTIKIFNQTYYLSLVRVALTIKNINTEYDGKKIHHCITSKNHINSFIFTLFFFYKDNFS